MWFCPMMMTMLKPPACRGNMPQQIELFFATDDAGDAGNTSTEANIPSPIGSGASGTTRSPAADQAPTTPTTGAQGWKCLHNAMKRSDQGHSADEVITQVELPPYRGPQSLLNLVASTHLAV
jgi:hypothetical protein